MLAFQRLRSNTTYVCASCTRHISLLVNARSQHGNPLRHARGYTTALSSARRIRSPVAGLNKTNSQKTKLQHNAYSTASTSRGRLRIAIVGSGPAGFYTAYRLINKLEDAVVDMYEQLPVPYGLVRFGVAPDHPDVKNCQDTFEELAKSPRFNYIGNVRVGHDIELAKLKPHYDAMLFSYGASEDRQLGMPGEDLPGVYSAREFVGWYNGLPQFQGLKPDLLAGEQAVVIGQGNVAMDVARMLLTPVDVLRSTDITEEAVQALSESKIRRVKVVGRRGPVQAAFTVKEARELMHIPSVAFEPIDPSFYPPNIKKLERVQRRVGEVLLKGTPVAPSDKTRSWCLDFLKAPTSIAADSDHVSSITFTKQKFVNEEDRFLPSARVQATEETETVETQTVFRSVGYKSTALPGLSELGVKFDTKLGIIPNDIHGRIISPSAGPGDLTAGHIPGMYCAGWVKRGPTGVIASTMQDAFSSGDIIMQDWASDVPFLNHERGENKGTGLGWEGVKKEAEEKGIRALSWDDWKVIDKAERARGQKLGKEREKFSSVQGMLQALDG